jgi:FlaA1/EpsC-like NDP-sugar epimerase
MSLPSILRNFRPVLTHLGRQVDRLPRRLFSRWGQLSIDATLSAIAIWFSYQLRFDFSVPSDHQLVMWTWVLLLATVRPLCLVVSGVYRGTWRYFDLRDALSFAVSATPPTLFMLLLRIGSRGASGIKVPLIVIVTDYFMFLLLSLGVRGLRRLLHEASLRNSSQKRTLLVGTEEGLASVLRQITLRHEVLVTGLLATSERLVGSRIGGFTVLGTPTGLAKQLATGEVDLVLVADSDVDSIGKSISTAMEFGVEVRLLPSAQNVISGDVRVSTTPHPELAIVHSRALPSEPHPAVVDTFRNRSVLITGAGGSIGAELSRQVARLPVSRVLLLDQNENAIFTINGELTVKDGPPLIPLVADIRDRERMWSIFAKYRPQIVLHAAAYKHVPVMEHNCAEAVLNNVLGTRTVAEASVTFAAERFLMISTDKAVNPSSMMGATKRVAEMLVQHLGGRQNEHDNPTRCTCVRFGNVVGSSGSVVPIFLRQIANGGPVTITNAEMTRYFMTIPEAVQLVLQASSVGCNGEIYMLDMGDPIKITSLARRLIELSGLRPDKDIEIRIVGSRPGEKLHEQLWTDSTSVSRTSFPRVLRIHPTPPSEDFQGQLQALEAMALTYDDDLVRETMSVMPIGYEPAVNGKARQVVPPAAVARKDLPIAAVAHRNAPRLVDMRSATG